MLVFLDTEFTDFAKHGLISLALVPDVAADDLLTQAADFDCPTPKSLMSLD